MTDTDKSLASELRDHAETMKRDKGKFVRFIDAAVCLETADRIEALSAENERLREEVQSLLDELCYHGMYPNVIEVHDAALAATSGGE